MKQSKLGLINILFIVGGAAFIVVTLGFFFQMPWATAIWPWPDGRLSYIFIASITAAIAAPMIWIGLSGEFAAAKGGAVNLGATALGAAVYFFILYFRDGGTQLLVTAVISAFAVLLNAAIYLWSRRIPIQDKRPMPRLVRISFAIFSVVLLLVGILLVTQQPVVFPWPLMPESSVIFGCIFLGAMLYFVTGLRGDKWHEARGQLYGFLAYDLILIGPFLAHFGSVNDEHLLSLIIYVTVLVYSGAVAIYYLFVKGEFRSSQGNISK